MGKPVKTHDSTRGRRTGLDNKNENLHGRRPDSRRYRPGADGSHCSAPGAGAAVPPAAEARPGCQPRGLAL